MVVALLECVTIMGDNLLQCSISNLVSSAGMMDLVVIVLAPRKSATNHLIVRLFRIQPSREEQHKDTNEGGMRTQVQMENKPTHINVVPTCVKVKNQRLGCVQCLVQKPKFLKCMHLQEYPSNQTPSQMPLREDADAKI